MTLVSPAPLLTLLTRLEIEVGSPLDLGIVAGEHRRIVPITGGIVRGRELSGQVLPGGADFQVLHVNGRQELEAKYAIMADDGTRMFVVNSGLRAGSAADLERIARGELVDAEDIYFYSSPKLAAPPGKWEWLNSRILVARGERLPDRVCLDVYVVE